MKYYWTYNGSILEEFDNFETAWTELNKMLPKFQMGLGDDALLVEKNRVEIVCSEEYQAPAV